MGRRLGAICFHNSNFSGGSPANWTASRRKSSLVPFHSSCSDASCGWQWTEPCRQCRSYRLHRGPSQEDLHGANETQFTQREKKNGLTFTAHSWACFADLQTGRPVLWPPARMKKCFPDREHSPPARHCAGQELLRPQSKKHITHPNSIRTNYSSEGK